MNEPNNQSGNSTTGAIASTQSFQPRAGTFILLFFLIVIWPMIGLSLLFFDSGDIDWDLYDPVYFIYLPTIAIQWFIFLAVALGVYREQSDVESVSVQDVIMPDNLGSEQYKSKTPVEQLKSGFKSIGFSRPKVSHLVSAVLFLVVSNLLLSALQLLLSLFDITISQNVDELVEKAGESTWWWLAISVTAAICEETTFRGYIMTRVKGVFRKSSWALPVVLSSFAFATGHTYQGVGGLILLFVYGLMFCGLYLYSKSIWPCIMAHFIQDFSAIFLYEYLEF